MTTTERLILIAMAILIAFFLKYSVGEKIKNFSIVTSREIAEMGR